MKKIVLFAVAMIFASATASHASLGMGARALGMGGAFTAVSNDETSLYWNVSALATDEGKNFTLSIPTFGVQAKSNLDRDEVDELDGDEIETLGNAELKLGISGMLGFRQKGFGIAALMDADGNVKYDGATLKEIEDIINAIEAGGAVPATAPSTSLESEFFGTYGGAVGYAMSFKGFDVGATVKVLNGQYYRANVGQATIDTQGDPVCTNCYIIDADGNGYGLDVAVSKRFKTLSVIKDARVAFVVRDLIGQIDVSGTKTGYVFSDKGTLGNPDFKLEEDAATKAGYTTTIDLAPEISLGIAGKTVGNVTVAADASLDTSSGIFGLSVGAEKELGIFALRAGAGKSTVTEKFNWALGFGLDFSAIKLDLAYGSGAGEENEMISAALRLAF